MVNIELQLLATILHTGRYDPIVSGELTDREFLTNEGKVIFNFVRTFREEANGEARYPSLSIVQNRFRNAGFILPTPAPADDVSALLHEVRIQRMRADMRVIGQQLLDGAEGDDPLSTITSQFSSLREMSTKAQPLRHLSLKDAAFDLLMRYESGDILKQGIEWPWPTLQEHTKGVQRKEFVVFAGRPKSRKTFTALKVMAHAALRGHRALIFTPEMPPDQIMMRMVGHMAKVRYRELKGGELDPEEYERFCTIVDLYGNLTGDEEKYRYKLRTAFDKHDLPDDALPGVDIIQSTNKPVSWLSAQISAHAPDIAMVDSFYRQAPDVSRKNGSETDRVTGVSRGLKDLSMEHNLPIIGTHQINRAGDKDVGNLSNLALADAIGQDADIIVRVVTGKLNGQDCSALAVLGGRELPIEGVLIHSIPCINFDEIAAITNKKQVEDLMKQEDAEEAKEENEKARNKARIASTQFQGGNTSQTKFGGVKSAAVEGAPEPTPAAIREVAPKPDSVDAPGHKTISKARRAIAAASSTPRPRKAG